MRIYKEWVLHKIFAMGVEIDLSTQVGGKQVEHRITEHQTVGSLVRLSYEMQNKTRQCYWGTRCFEVAPHLPLAKSMPVLLILCVASNILEINVPRINNDLMMNT